MKPACNRNVGVPNFFPLKAGSVIYRYWMGGKAVCYGFITDITSFPTEFIKHNLISLCLSFSQNSTTFSFVFGSSTGIFILGPCLTAKTRLFSLGAMQNGLVTGLLTDCNIQRRHLNKIGLTEVFCVGSAGQRKKSQLTFCMYEALIALKHHYPAWE